MCIGCIPESVLTSKAVYVYLYQFPSQPIHIPFTDIYLTPVYLDLCYLAARYFRFQRKSRFRP